MAGEGAAEEEAGAEGKTRKYQAQRILSVPSDVRIPADPVSGGQFGRGQGRFAGHYHIPGFLFQRLFKNKAH